MALFSGSNSAHGSYSANITPDGSRHDGKHKGQAITVREPVTDALWRAHLDGKAGLGIVPIREDSSCLFGAIDIDVYQDFDLPALAAKIAGFQLPLIVCRSKSGGAHVYLFAGHPVPASSFRARLNDIANRVGHAGCEVFPKQDRKSGDELGSWINMPYFSGDGTNRYAINAAGDPLSASEFLEAAERAKQPAAWFEKPLPWATASATPGAPKRSKPPFSLPNVIEAGQRDTTLTSAAGKMRRAGLSTGEIEAALRQINEDRCRPPLDDADIVRIAKSIGRKEPAPANEDAGLIKALATEITATESFARDQGTLLYHFENGVYKPTGQRIIERRVKALCEAWDCTKSWTPELAKRVYEWLLVDAPELWERPPIDVLNVRNGLLDVQGGALREHSPAHLSPVQLAASFDPGSRCPHIDRFIQDVFPEDTRHLPYEIAAWLMLPDTSIQKAVLALGEGANGKSVWLNVLMGFLGKENVSTLSLHKIEQDKFAAARLVGKLCNIGTDLPTAALAGTSMFKALTGGDTITAERKFESSFEFRPFVRLLFSANSAPRSDDATHGFFRRWLCIPFTRTFDESAPDTVPRAVLDARLCSSEELSGLLNRALEALPTIRTGRFTESGSTRAALNEFRQTTDPLAVWLDSNTVTRPDAITPKDQVRSAYSKACQEAGRPIMPDTQFTRALLSLRSGVQMAQRRINGKPARVFLGLGLVFRDQGAPDDALF